MDKHSDVQSIRYLYAAYRSILHELRAQADWLRGSNGLEHEAECLESQARSLEQNFARMMREALRREGATIPSERAFAVQAKAKEAATVEVMKHAIRERDEARAEIERLKAAQANTIAFPLAATMDIELTCIFCALQKCTHEIAVLGAGRRAWCGLHEACAARHTDRMMRKGPPP